jgi:seryl-tRNA synthetase
LKESLDKEGKAKEDIRKELTADLESAQERVAQIEKELEVTQTRNKELETIRQDLETQVGGLKTQIDALTKKLTISGDENIPDDGAAVQEGVDLEPIVINTGEDSRGSVISVDKEADFLIVSLGDKHGIKKGMLLSIYREEKYLGDVEVSRVLPEMSAADVVPPLRSEKVRKDDSVVVKE